MIKHNEMGQLPKNTPEGDLRFTGQSLMVKPGSQELLERAAFFAKGGGVRC